MTHFQPLFMSTCPCGRLLVLSTWPGCIRASTPHVSTWLSVYPSICLAVRACVLSPGFDFRLNRRPVRRVEASGSLEAPGRGEGARGQVSSQGGCSVLGLGVARGAPGRDGRMDGWIHWLMIVFPLRQKDIDHSRESDWERLQSRVNYFIRNILYREVELSALHLCVRCVRTVVNS